MALKYLSASLGTRNWNDTTGTWVTANGGTTPTTAPTTADTAFLTSLSGAVTVNTASCVTGTLTGTGYASTITINASCVLVANLTLTISATTTIVNNGTLSWRDGNGAGDLSSGVSIPGAFRFGGGGNSTGTISSNITCLGAVTMTGQQKINGAFNIYIKNGWSGGGNIVSGTCSIYLQGGEISSVFGTANVYLDGNITYKTGTTTFSYVGFGSVANATTLTWNSGTVTSTGSYTQIRGTITINTGSDVVFDRLQFNPSVAHTCVLSDDLYATNILIEGADGKATTIDGAFKIKVSGGIRSYTTNAFYSNYFKGTATFEMVGTGTLGLAQNFAGSSSSKTVTYIENPITINTAGTCTFGGVGVSGSGTLTYTTGTIAGFGGIYVVGTYSITGNFTLPLLSFGGNNWGQSTYPGGPYVCNLLSDITINTLILNNESTLNITDTKTVTVATAINSRGDSVNLNAIASTGTGTINFTGSIVNNNIVYTDFTNIDSTNQMYVYKGSVTNCNNINVVGYADLGSPRFTLIKL